MNFWDITIVFNDGTVEVVQRATDVYVKDGCLEIHKKHGYMNVEHLGSFPLSGIRVWTKKEA